MSDNLKPTPTIQALHKLELVVRRDAPSTTVSFRLFLDSEEAEVTYSLRSPDALREAGIPMKNLRGEWIRPAESEKSP